MSRKNMWIVVAVVLVVLVGALGFYKMKQGNDYSIVYLTTGEVYIGKLTTIPDFQLKDTYILQITKDTVDPTKSNFQLNPVKDAL